MSASRTQQHIFTSLYTTWPSTLPAAAEMALVKGNSDEQPLAIE